MNKLFGIILVGLLAACHDGSHVGGQHDRLPCEGRGCGNVGASADMPYGNVATKSNQNITGMVSNNNSQMGNYIAHRLAGYMITSVPVNDYKDIAKAAIWLTSDDVTEEEIAQMFYQNQTLLHNALYVINNKSLHGCMNYNVDNGGASAAKCFMDWRKNNKEYFDKIAKELRDNADVLFIENASFKTADNKQLKFLIDGGVYSSGTGKITAIVVDDETFNRVGDTDTFTKGNSLLTYNSIGKELGLSYSDFGTYNIVKDTDGVKETTVATTVFAGGYEERRIQPENITTDLAFTGRAVGKATKLNENVDLDGKAVLNFDAKTGVSDLWAYFGNWYDVNVKSDGSIGFTNYTNKYDQAMLSDTADKDGFITDSGAEMDVGYYGQNPNNGRPTEAAGMVHYEEKVQDGVELNMAFGAK